MAYLPVWLAAAQAAMRLLCGALRYRYYREGAARCRLVGTERADDHRGRGCGARQYRHAPAGRPLRRPRQEPGRGPGRRRPRARAGDVAGLGLHPDRPAQGPEPPRFGRPPARRGEISATGPRAGAGRRSAARQPPGRPRRRRPAPRSGAEPRGRLLSGRPARRPRGRTSAGLRRSGRLPWILRRGSGPASGPGCLRNGPGTWWPARHGAATRQHHTAARVPAGRASGAGACSRDGSWLEISWSVWPSAPAGRIPRADPAGRGLPPEVRQSGSRCGPAARAYAPRYPGTARRPRPSSLRAARTVRAAALRARAVRAATG
jgi:hypothetical protein